MENLKTSLQSIEDNLDRLSPYLALVESKQIILVTTILETRV